MNKIKYNVSIPKPSAKRMSANKKIVLTLSDGWIGDIKKEFLLNENDSYFNFEVDEDRQPIRSSTCMDGPCFKVEIVYTNSNKTRTEVIELIPMKINPE